MKYSSLEDQRPIAEILTSVDEAVHEAKQQLAQEFVTGEAWRSAVQTEELAKLVVVRMHLTTVAHLLAELRQL